MFRLALALTILLVLAFYLHLAASAQPAAATRPATTRSATRPATTRAAATRPTTHDELMAAMVEFTNDTAAILKGATDEKSAKAAVPRLAEARQRLLVLRDATESLGPMNDLTRGEVFARHGVDFNNANIAMREQIERIRKDAKLDAILGRSIDDLSVFRSRGESTE